MVIHFFATRFFILKKGFLFIFMVRGVASPAGHDVVVVPVRVSHVTERIARHHHHLEIAGVAFGLDRLRKGFHLYGCHDIFVGCGHHRHFLWVGEQPWPKVVDCLKMAFCRSAVFVECVI